MSRQEKGERVRGLWSLIRTSIQTKKLFNNFGDGCDQFGLEKDMVNELDSDECEDVLKHDDLPCLIINPKSNFAKIINSLMQLMTLLTVILTPLIVFKLVEPREELDRKFLSDSA